MTHWERGSDISEGLHRAASDQLGKQMEVKGPVKVLVVFTHPIQYYSHLLARYAQDSRLDLTVAYCSLQGADAGVDPDFAVPVAWDVPLLEGYRWIHPANRALHAELQRFMGLFNPGLWRVIRRESFEVVVCHGYGAASLWIAAAAAKSSGAALAFATDAHSLAPVRGGRWKIPLKRLLVPRIYGLAEGALGLSPRAVSFLRTLGLPSVSVHLWPLAVDNDFFAKGIETVDRAKVRAGWGIPEEATVALFSGKLVPWKRPADILRAAASIDDLFLVVAGDGVLRPALRSLAGELGIMERVRFLGFVNQSALPELYASADVLVLPSAHEPFGLVVNEAFACGLPAIVSEACGAAGDLVRDGETGYVIPVGSVEALTERLFRLSADSALRGAMGQRARQAIDARGPAANVEAFVSACAALAGRGRSRRGQ